MSTILTYDGLNIDSSELLRFRYSREFQVNRLGTVNDKIITQPGNLTPIIFAFECKITNDASTKYFQWRNKLQEKTLAALVFSGDDYGGFYLNNLDIDCDNLDENQNVLSFDLNLSFIQNQNFS